jgi:hypothetical protein
MSQSGRKQAFRARADYWQNPLLVFPAVALGGAQLAGEALVCRASAN